MGYEMDGWMMDDRYEMDGWMMDDTNTLVD